MFGSFPALLTKLFLSALNPIHIQEPRSLPLLNTITTRELKVPNLLQYTKLHGVFLCLLCRKEMYYCYVMLCDVLDIVRNAVIFATGLAKIYQSHMHLAGLAQKCGLSIQLWIGQLSQLGIMTWNQSMWRARGIITRTVTINKHCHLLEQFSILA